MNAAYLAILVGLLMLSYGCTAAQEPNGTSPLPIITNSTPAVPPANATPPPNVSNASGPTTPEGLARAECEAARGHWQECGSACRGAPAGTTCIAVCVAYCECGGIAGFGCPEGYQCSDYLPRDKNGNPVPDAMGICKKT